MKRVSVIVGRQTLKHRQFPSYAELARNLRVGESAIVEVKETKDGTLKISGYGKVIRKSKTAYEFPAKLKDKP